jgi:hypothetical protein
MHAICSFSLPPDRLFLSLSSVSPPS